MIEETIYIAYDGCKFDDRNDCLSYEHFCDQVYRIEYKLKQTPCWSSIDNGQGYLQQDIDTVNAAREDLILLLKDKNPERYEQFTGDEHGGSIIGRIIDDCELRSVKNLWHRFMCIDEKGREFDQMYFVSHPHEAKLFDVGLKNPESERETGPDLT